MQLQKSTNFIQFKQIRTLHRKTFDRRLDDFAKFCRFHACDWSIVNNATILLV